MNFLLENQIYTPLKSVDPDQLSFNIRATLEEQNDINLNFILVPGQVTRNFFTCPE